MCINRKIQTYIYIYIIYEVAVTILIPFSKNETNCIIVPYDKYKVTGINTHMAYMGYRNMCFIDISLTSHIETRICIVNYSIRRGELYRKPLLVFFSISLKQLLTKYEKHLVS